MELFCVYRYHVLFIIDNLRSAISPVVLFLFGFLLVQVGSDSVQGAGAPTMFQAMRRVVECLAHEYVGEGGFERAIRQSFLGIVPWKLYRSITKIMLLLDYQAWKLFMWLHMHRCNTSAPTMFQYNEMHC